MTITNSIDSLRCTRTHRLFDRLFSAASSRNSSPSFVPSSFAAVVLGVGHTDSLALNKHWVVRSPKHVTLIIRTIAGVQGYPSHSSLRVWHSSIGEKHGHYTWILSNSRRYAALKGSAIVRVVIKQLMLAKLLDFRCTKRTSTMTNSITNRMIRGCSTAKVNPAIPRKVSMKRITATARKSQASLLNLP